MSRMESTEYGKNELTVYPMELFAVQLLFQFIQREIYDVTFPVSGYGKSYLIFCSRR